MARIIVDIRDERKVETFLAFLRDLPYVETRSDCTLKKWKGNVPMLETPIPASEFKVFTREELHER